jgi:hypothetical protein
VKHENKISIL